MSWVWKEMSVGPWLWALMLSACITLAPEAMAQEEGETPADTAAEVEAGEMKADASTATEEDAGFATLEEIPAETSQYYTINTLVMFICAVLVIFMQAGFAMLEVGLNAAKNTVNILAKNVTDLSVGVLLFLFIGFALMYPGAPEDGVYPEGQWFVDGWLGKPSAFVERDAQVDDDGNLITQPGADYSSSADFLFQVAFAATAATIVSGAVAGRMKFTAYLVYSGLLTGIIYPISGSWKWGGGFLDAAGFQDFAGSVVVHAVGGFAGLAGAILLGPRLGRYTAEGKSVPLPGHNVAFAALGVFILWVGWYGFNPGSQLTYDGVANAELTTYIALTTTISAAAGAVVALVLAWILFGKPDLTMALNGVLGGLVSITANCDQVTQPNALIIGGVGGALVVLGVVFLDKLKIDDPVGAWPVHGLCGVWGGISTGLFGFNVPDAVDGRGGYIWVQLYSTVVICAWAFVTMFLIFAVLKLIGALRVSAEEETAGLDISEHGMHAYPSDAITGGTVS